jgi:hypothetical protein
MKFKLIIAVVTAIGFCPIADLKAETTGWSWGPFASSTSKTDVGVQTAEPKKWLPEMKVPDVAGSMKKATQSVTIATSNAWNSTSKATKQAWKKTTKALDPFPDSPGPSVTGASSKSEPKTSGFSGWFGGSKAKDEGPQTMQDFLSQKRLE